MVGFTTFSLHTAPLAEKFLFGGFDPHGRINSQWASFVWHASKGPLSHMESNTFPADFREKYAARRAALEVMAESKNSFRASTGEAPARKAGSRAGPSPEGSGDEESPDDGDVVEAEQD